MDANGYQYQSNACMGNQPTYFANQTLSNPGRYIWLLSEFTDDDGHYWSRFNSSDDTQSIQAYVNAPSNPAIHTSFTVDGHQIEAVRADKTVNCSTGTCNSFSPSFTAYMGNSSQSAKRFYGIVSTDSTSTTFISSQASMYAALDTAYATITTALPFAYSANPNTNTSVAITYDPLPVQPSATTSLPAVNYPFATSTVATTTLNRLTVATTTQYTTYTPFSDYTDDTRGTKTTYLTFNGQLVAAYTYDKTNLPGGKVTYIHTNYLGTPVLETDDKGDIVEMDVTDSFGNYIYRDQRKDSPYHNKAYTGHEYDDVTGLTYAHARYLDTKAHTFISVDPLLYSLPQAYLLDPQQMNSYAYARNNPIIYTDPTGLAALFYGPPSPFSKNNNAGYYVPSVSFSRGNSTPTFLNITNPRPQPTITRSNIDNLIFSGYGGMARDDWRAGNYGMSTTMGLLGFSSAVSTVFTGPEKMVIATGKIAFREGVIASDLLGGKTITATSHGSLRSELAKQIDLPKGIQMHHIVEQNSANVARFGEQMIHNSDNIVFLSRANHTPITTAFNSLIGPGITLRQKVGLQGFADQYQIGMDILRNVLPK